MNVTLISHVLVIRKIYTCERASAGSVDFQQFDLNVKNLPVAFKLMTIHLFNFIKLR